ncbi:hypothetical protein ACQE98_04720 [Ornithinimicrobium sp. W1679]|uniref:hypothetical protein n=1 Tax=Ornithinimicrobium sp. W1679 TaxID=3418770 RepID=UPI003CF47503
MSGPHPFVTLTDSELAVLEEAHLRELAGEPEPDATDPGGADLGGTDPDVADLGGTDPDGAFEHARRTLRAGGLLTADGDLVPGDVAEDGAPDLPAAVGLALDVRLSADVRVVASRLVGPLLGVGPQEHRPVRSTRVLHLVTQGACVEDLDEEGLHSLALTTDQEQAARSLEEALLPPDAADGRGGPVQVDTTRIEHLAEALGRPTVLAELAVLVPEGGDGPGAPAATGVLLAMGPGGCWAGPTAVDEDGRTTLHPVPRTWLGDRARLTVDAVLGTAADGAEGTMAR